MVDWARIGATGEVVGAEEARRRKDYFCAHCNARVILRRGEVYRAYFAHKPGEGSIECEHYYPSFGTQTAATNTDQAHDSDGRKDEAERLALLLEDSGTFWNILLGLPEIPDGELGVTSLGALRGALISVHAAGKVSRLSALEVRPGGPARAIVSPSSLQYRIEPTGTWPTGVKSARYQAFTDGLRGEGTLFRASGSEWLRLRDGARVRWGDALRLVAHDLAAPTALLDAEEASAIIADGVKWKLWRVSLPAKPSVPVESWLSRLGYRVAPPVWKSASMSVATRFDERVGFPPQHPVIVVLKPPAPNASAMLRVRYGTNTQTQTITADGYEALWLALTLPAPTTADVEVASEASASITFDVESATAFEPIRDQLRAVPRLGVAIGTYAAQAWADITPCPRSGEVRLSGVDDARLDLIVVRSGQRRVTNGLSCRDAERLIAESLAEASLIEIDAGNLGRLELRLQMRETRTSSSTDVRIARWLDAAARGCDGAPVFVSNGRRYVTYRPKRELLPHFRLYARRVRGETGQR